LIGCANETEVVLEKLDTGSCDSDTALKGILRSTVKVIRDSAQEAMSGNYWLVTDVVE